MNELPAGLAEPLHLLDPHPYLTAMIWAALALLLFLLWRIWRGWRRRSPPAAAESGTAAAPPAVGVSAIEVAIQEIRGRYAEANIRQGCHELSETLRSHFERSGQKALSTLTAREITRVLGDVGGFFELLAELQFRRRRPISDEFHDICDLAVDTVTTSSTKKAPAKKAQEAS